MSSDLERRLLESLEDKGPRAVLSVIALSIHRDEPLSPLFKEWLISRLVRVIDGESADEAFGTKRDRGDRSKPWAKIRAILQEIAFESINSECSLSTAAATVAERHHKDDSVYQKLARKHEDYLHFYRRVLAGDIHPHEL